MDRDDLSDIGRYQKFLEEETSSRYLNKKAKIDLDFDSLFEVLDKTSSPVGQQYLYHVLSKPKYEIDELVDFDRTVEHVAADAGLQKKIKKALGILKSRSLYWMPAVFLKPLSKEPKWFVVVPLLSLAMLVSLVGFFVYMNTAWFVFAFSMFILNAAIFWSHKGVIDYELRSITQLGKLAKVGHKLSDLEIESIDSVELKTSASAISKISRWIVSITIEANPFDPLSQSGVFLADNIKAAFLYDLMVLYFNLRQIKKHREDIHTLFKAIGYADAAMSVASFRGSNEFTKPKFVSGNAQMSIGKARHPLVKECVPNSISIDTRGILVTGSNMSGKTTFIKAVAVNALMAQTVYTTLTEEYRAPFLDVYASIGVADDINKGKSYYLSELEAVKVIADVSDGNRQCLFVIDELFKGTNTLERLAAAKELLAYLAKSTNHIILMATHDVDLAKMLKDQYELYYFSEQVENTELNFDYKIKQGVLKTGNAIKLLGIVGFPATMVKAAATLSTRLERSQRSVTL